MIVLYLLGNSGIALSFAILASYVGWLSWRRPDLAPHVLAAPLAIFVFACAVSRAIKVMSVWTRIDDLEICFDMATSIVALTCTSILLTRSRSILATPRREEFDALQMEHRRTLDTLDRVLSEQHSASADMRAALRKDDRDAHA